MLVTVFLVTLFVFVAFDLIPGDAATAKLGTNATPESIEALREELGLNKPLLVRYFAWLYSFFFGDMGTSYSYGMPVRTMLMQKLPITLFLTLISFLMMLGISFPLGLYSAKYEDRWISKLLDSLNQITMSIPPFFIGILITYIFGIVLRVFVPGGFVSYNVNFGKFIAYLIFPSIAIALPKAAMNTKMLKTSILSQASLRLSMSSTTSFPAYLSLIACSMRDPLPLFLHLPSTAR